MLAVAEGSPTCAKIVTAAGGEAAVSESAAACPKHAVVQECAALLLLLHARATLAANEAMEALLFEEAEEKAGSGLGKKQSKASRKREAQRLRKAVAAHRGVPPESPPALGAAAGGAQVESAPAPVEAAEEAQEAGEAREGEVDAERAEEPAVVPTVPPVSDADDAVPTKHAETAQAETAQAAGIPTVVAPTAAALGLPTMADETSTLGGGTTCSICFMGTKSHVAVPCGHQFACGDCADVLTRKGEPCPMCRKAISVFIQVHVC